MIIQRWKMEGFSNFGDELNAYLWPRLLDSAVASLPGHFYGIGTILHMPPHPERNVIFGAGGGYGPAPLLDATQRSYFVRGPRTSAETLIPYITDPGILVRRFHTRNAEPSIPVSFMPRWDSIDEEMASRLSDANIHMIDPRWPVPQVIAGIADSQLLLTEALHGAVCADALRTPWVSIYAARGHEMKWLDWCGSLDMVWNPIDAESFTLRWAQLYAVPQLSALSILHAREATMLESIDRLNADAKEGRL